MALTLELFIEKVLIGEIKTIQQNYGHYYLSFGLIAQGIELLGACLDSSEFHKKGASSVRFRKAIEELFPVQYQAYNNALSDYDLYENLRCGLLHVVIPKNSIELIQESEKSIFGEHLEIKSIRGQNRLILVAQDLFDDFEKACREVINRIEAGVIDQSKITGALISNDP